MAGALLIWLLGRLFGPFTLLTDTEIDAWFDGHPIIDDEEYRA